MTAETTSVEVRHDLAKIPLSAPSRTSGVLEVFRRRHLLRLMARREIRARYAGTAFGLAWSYINPLTRFLTFYAVFGLLLGRGMGVENFAIHLFAGMVLVTYFSETVLSGTRSLLSNKGVIAKMAMPREMFPVVSMLVSLWHTFPMMVILVLACVITGWRGDGPLWVPDATGLAAALLGLVLMLVLGTALGLMFSCVNVIFRDFQRIVATFMTMIQFSAPMMYPYHMVATRLEPLPAIASHIYFWNPVAHAVMLIQRGFWYTTCEPNCATSVNLETGVVEPAPALASNLFERGFIMLGISLVLLVVAQVVFQRLEKSIPERL